MGHGEKNDGRARFALSQRRAFRRRCPAIARLITSHLLSTPRFRLHVLVSAFDFLPDSHYWLCTVIGNFVQIRSYLLSSIVNSHSVNMAPSATNGEVASTSSKGAVRHPFDQLSDHEVDVARDVIVKARQSPVLFRNVFTVEPPKAQMVKFLAAENAGTLSAETPRPARQARVQYDVIREDKNHQYMESVVDIASASEVSKREREGNLQQALTVDEFREFNEVVVHSELFKKAVADFELPEGFEVAIDPWPYGGPDEEEDFCR